MKYTPNILLIALAYYVTGRIGLLLAIPPGFATAAWPPSGIALAGILLCGYRHWPGVFLGSFLINVFIAFDTSSIDALIKSAEIAGGIACGASIQAVISAWLVRKSGAWPSSLELPREVGNVLLWGGIVGCAINATIGTAIIALPEHPGFSQFMLHWATWWVGDTVGVLVFTPVLLLLLGNRKEVSRNRKLVTSSSLILVFGLTIGMFALVSKWEAQRLRFVFEQDSAQIIELIEKDLISYQTVLNATQSFFNASREVTPDEFRKYTSVFFPAYPGLQGLSWNARVEGSNRAAFEKWAKKAVSPTFAIKDRTPDGNIVPAPARPLYFPVTYLSSVDGNTAALGYDTYGPDPVDMDRRARALNKARDIAATCTTGKISIIQEGTDQSGMLFYKPIYKDGIAGNSPEQRREKLTGYVAGVFLIKKMIDASLSSAKFLLGKMDITIYEMADEPSPSLLFDTSRGPDKGSAPSVRQRLGKDYDLAVASGTWKVHIEEKNVSEPAKYNWTLWAVLIGGLLITAILSAFLLVLTGRTAAVQREVEEKTLSMKRLTEKLIRSNTELERFAYVASHDMQEPIRMIASFGGLLAAMPANNKTEKEKQYLGFVTESANRLQAMVEDLLEYARIGNTAQRFIGVDLNKQLEFALQNLSGAISDRHAEITVDRLPLVSGNPFQLARLFQNLIQNSLKYQQQGIFPRIHISSADEGNHWRISVADNGEGIAAEYIARIFEPFRRLHSWHEEKGTGLGLAICKTIVEGHGGNIWATSEPGKGSIFYFTMPKQERGA